MSVQEFAFAKLNLTLDVTARREDGYHDMVMVMQTISLTDRIVIGETGDSGIRVKCNYRYVPTDERNLAVKAAKIFLRAAGEEDRGIQIQMEKSIPVGAGMAGGSADAAAVLRGLNRLFGKRFERRELEKLAEEIGSDVPFCVAGGTALARGRGEVLEDLEPMPECRIVVCKPGFSISTPELFRKLDQAGLKRHPDTEIVAYVRSRVELARKQVAEWGENTPCFRTMEEAFAAVKADMVVLVTPPEVHFEEV